MARTTIPQRSISVYNELLQQLPQENIIVGGDFNLVIDYHNDSNYKNDNNIHAKKSFINIVKKYNLIDTWRHMHHITRNIHG